MKTTTKLKIATILTAALISTTSQAEDCHNCGNGGFGGDFNQQQGVNHQASPTFNNASTMAGSQSNVAVQNVQMTQTQSILGISCESGVGVMGSVYGSRNESNPFGYTSNNVGVNVSVGMTLFDDNLDNCTNAQKAILMKIKHEAVNNKFQFCGNFYVTMNDPRAPKFNFKAIRYQAERKNNLIAQQIMECMSFIEMDSTEHHQNFASATPKMKQDFDTGRNGVKVNAAKESDIERLQRENRELQLRLDIAKQQFKK